MSASPRPVSCGPGVGRAADQGWPEVLDLLARVSVGQVSVNRGWDLGWELEQWRSCAAEGREQLSVRWLLDEVQIGPRWLPGTDAGCAGCTELRERTVLDHPLVGDLTAARAGHGECRPWQLELVVPVLRHLLDFPLSAGELYSVASGTTRRHRVPRSSQCPVCSTPPTDQTALPPLAPARRVPRDVATSAGDPTRGAVSSRVLDQRSLRGELVDSRFGPVRGILREFAAPFAMSMAMVPDAPAIGHGRARTFGAADPVAVFEVYERLAGFPFDTALLTGASYVEVADFAVDPATLGGYTAEQLAHPSCRVMPWSPTAPMDWAWGTDLRSGAPVLVPADVAFYQYDYRYQRDRRAARAADPLDQLRFFHESSSGCAVGSTVAEASLHALLEVIERDAFLISWFRGQPLPEISCASIADPTCLGLIDLIEAAGFVVHLLVASQDVALPVVWVLAVNAEQLFPVSFSSAGSSADPQSAVRGALREVAQLVTMSWDWGPADVAAMVADPWLVQDLEDHVRVNSAPAVLSRAAAVLGGPQVTLAEAFPGWPQRMRSAARGSVGGALHFVGELLGDAGLDQVLLVDQSSQEHLDAQIGAVKAVVPGTVPMCFGHAQRLVGLPRLDAALAGTAAADRSAPFDPHPFP